LDVDAEKSRNGWSGNHGGRFGEAEPDIMTVFRATKTRPFPAGYLIPPAFPEAVTLLRRPGIAVDRLEAAWSGTAQVFEVASISPPSETRPSSSS
jgi:hypothetical protein